jgi:hypothetical protein
MSFIRDILVHKSAHSKINLTSNDKCNIDVINNWVEESLITPIPVDLCINGCDSIITDLEIIKDNTHTGCGSVFEKVNFTKTHGGSRILKELLSNPINDATVLKLRQKIIKRVSNVYQKKSSQINNILNTMKEREFAISWFLDKRTKEEEELLKMVYFSKKLTKGLNNNTLALQTYSIYKLFVCPSIGILSPIIYFVIPFLILRIKYKLTIGFTDYLKTLYKSSQMLSGGKGALSASFLFSLVFYFQSIFSQFDIAKTVERIVSMISYRYISMLEFVEATKKLADMFDGSFDQSLFGIIEFEHCNLLDIDISRTMSYTKIGDLLNKFRNFDISNIKGLVITSYALDAIISVCKAKQELNLCLVEYNLRSKQPTFDIVDGWHICLKNPVTNSLSIGDKEPRNIIVTGPNAGGKSTFIKSVMINTLLAQTICIAAAKTMTTTVFSRLFTQMNIPDCKGKESLFEAEMNRCKEKVDIVESLDNNEFMILAVDEMFSSTEPLEGIAAAYAVAKTISQYQNIVLLVTTHYKYLCNLSNEENFANFKMTATINQGSIKFPYQLCKGVSDQQIALELLKQKGFTEKIVDYAIKIRQRLIQEKMYIGTKNEDKNQPL